MKIQTPLSRRKSEVLHGVRDLVIGLHISKLEKEIEDIRDREAARIQKCLETGLALEPYMAVIREEDIGQIQVQIFNLLDQMTNQAEA